MRSISSRVSKELHTQLRMKQCVIRDLQDLYGPCGGKIEWDHVWIYAGRQIDEPWAIVGLCHDHHMAKEGEPAVKAAVQTASLMLATIEELSKYSRKDWEQIKHSLGI